MRNGFTLLEMVVVTSLLAMVLAAGVPAARRSIDRMAVVGAREGLVGMVIRTRSEARARGGAALVVDPLQGRARIESRIGVVDSLDLGRAFGVRVQTGVTDRSVRLEFDGLGIGRVASRTIAIRRGAGRAAIVVSSYGRVSRR